MIPIIKITQSGSFKHTERFLNFASRLDIEKRLRQYADEGVEALSRATPVDTGKTAASWGYTLETSRDHVYLNFTNSNVNDGVPIAIVIQYGHIMPNGYYVQGIDYINPAIRPVFDKISETIWKDVTNA